jgi:hypothetical protein
VVRIFIVLKIHRRLSGLNQRTLGPMANTLSTKPPRTTLIHFRLILILSFHICVCLPNYRSASHFLAKISALFMCSMRAACSVHVIPPELITLIMYAEECKE